MQACRPSRLVSTLIFLSSSTRVPPLFLSFLHPLIFLHRCWLHPRPAHGFRRPLAPISDLPASACRGVSGPKPQSQKEDRDTVRISHATVRNVLYVTSGFWSRFGPETGTQFRTPLVHFLGVLFLVPFSRRMAGLFLGFVPRAVFLALFFISFGVHPAGVSCLGSRCFEHPSTLPAGP